MDGKTAFEYLRNMTEDERKEVNIIWFDRDTLRENLICDGVELKYSQAEKIIDKLPSDKVGEILEKSVYTESGDIQDYFNDFLELHDEKMTEKFKKICL